MFFVIQDKKVVLTLTYLLSTGRNFGEILRVIVSLPLTTYDSVATPANWADGEDVVILPSASEEETSDKFPNSQKEIKPYLRIAPQPHK